MYTKLKCFTCGLILVLTGCFAKQPIQPAPVISLPIKAEHIPAYHIVKRGESLYVIAWIYDLDVQKIAKLNRMPSLDAIYPGEKIYLKQPSPARAQRAPRLAASPKTQTKVAKAPTYNETQKKETVKSIAEVKTASASNEKWVWPAKGHVVKLFSTKQNDYNKGIDITGKFNDSVVAAKSGKVVYSGEGLRGYGKLIIIKHDDTYLSAYAHNNQLLVNEGDVVKQGAVIAKMGQTDSPNVKLHFQIRKNGQPVNPSNYLK